MRPLLPMLVVLALITACDRGRSVGLGTVIQLNPGLQTILPSDASLDRIADGFGLLEGPVWSTNGLLFSDMRTHRIYRWDSGARLFLYPNQILFLKKDDQAEAPSGPNGLAFDYQGRLTICEHGNRRVSRLERDGTVTVLAERYEGKRLNSPNDLVYRSDGFLYFTDPPSGLPGDEADPQRELPFSGVYLLSSDRLMVVSTELIRPNGLALSPDEHYLYVGSSGRDAVVMRYVVHPDGMLSKGEIFLRGQAIGNAQWFDGMKVDVRGNLYLTTSVGLVIVSAAGTHLGTVRWPEFPTNVAWGEEDAQTLYITAPTSLYRIRLSVQGSRAFRFRRP